MYQWLSSYQELTQSIAHKEWRLEKEKAELERWMNPKDLGRYSLVKESKASKLEEIIFGLEWDLAYEMDCLKDLRRLIYSFRGADQMILRMKYIEGLSLKQIAQEVGYTEQHVRRKHAKIMKQIKTLVEQKDQNTSLKSGYKNATQSVEKTC